MVIEGGYGAGREELPRVFKMSVARLQPEPAGEERFLVAVHEEGTAVTWQQVVRLTATERAALQADGEALHLWSVQRGLSAMQARDTAHRVGHLLYRQFIGRRGAKYLLSALGSSSATAFLLDLDETVQGWPWELMRTPEGPLAQRVPVGRLVRTGVIPKAGRDPTQEDDTVRLLAIVDSRADLAAARAGVEELRQLQGGAVELTVLIGAEATRAALFERLRSGDWDILHFAGHARFEPQRPGQSALMLADGAVTADEVLTWPWRRPPYLVFNSACEAGRSQLGRRVVSRRGHANGLASAFLAAGVQGYIGFFWPVADPSAGLFTRTFYRALLELRNVGQGLLEARRETQRQVAEYGDLAAFSAVYFGDAGGKARRDLATAA